MKTCVLDPALKKRSRSFSTRRKFYFMICQMPANATHFRIYLLHHCDQLFWSFLICHLFKEISFIKSTSQSCHQFVWYLLMTLVNPTARILTNHRPSTCQVRGGATNSEMGNTDTKLNFRKAVVQLTTKTQVLNDRWEQAQMQCTVVKFSAPLICLSTKWNPMCPVLSQSYSPFTTNRKFDCIESMLKKILMCFDTVCAQLCVSPKQRSTAIHEKFSHFISAHWQTHSPAHTQTLIFASSTNQNIQTTLPPHHQDKLPLSEVWTSINRGTVSKGIRDIILAQIHNDSYSQARATRHCHQPPAGTAQKFDQLWKTCFRKISEVTRGPPVKLEDFVFAACGSRRRGFLVAVLVRERQQCTGHIHVDPRRWDQSAARRVALEPRHIMLQSCRETRTSCRERLPDSHRTTNRYSLVVHPRVNIMTEINTHNWGNCQWHVKCVLEMNCVVGVSCASENNQQSLCVQQSEMRLSWFVAVLNCVRLLTRILPYIFEDPDWRGFFWSTLPGQSLDEEVDVSCIKFEAEMHNRNAMLPVWFRFVESEIPFWQKLYFAEWQSSTCPVTHQFSVGKWIASRTRLQGNVHHTKGAESNAKVFLTFCTFIWFIFLQDLMFCPDFTVSSNKKSGPVSCVFVPSQFSFLTVVQLEEFGLSLGCKRKVECNFNKAQKKKLQFEQHTSFPFCFSVQPGIFSSPANLERLEISHSGQPRGHADDRQLWVHLGGGSRVRSLPSHEPSLRPAPDGDPQADHDLLLRNHVPATSRYVNWRKERDRVLSWKTKIMKHLLMPFLPDWQSKNQMRTHGLKQFTKKQKTKFKKTDKKENVRDCCERFAAVRGKKENWNFSCKMTFLAFGGKYANAQPFTLRSWQQVNAVCHFFQLIVTSATGLKHQCCNWEGRGWKLTLFCTEIAASKEQFSSSWCTHTAEPVDRVFYVNGEPSRAADLHVPAERRVRVRSGRVRRPLQPPHVLRSQGTARGSRSAGEYIIKWKFMSFVANPYSVLWCFLRQHVSTRVAHLSHKPYWAKKPRCWTLELATSSLLHTRRKNCFEKEDDPICGRLDHNTRKKYLHWQDKPPSNEMKIAMRILPVFQVLCVTLDNDPSTTPAPDGAANAPAEQTSDVSFMSLGLSHSRVVSPSQRSQNTCSVVFSLWPLPVLLTEKESKGHKLLENNKSIAISEKQLFTKKGTLELTHSFVDNLEWSCNL